MAKVYASCEQANVDPSTGVCSQVVWVEDVPGWLPEVSAEDGLAIGSALFVLFLSAYAIRQAWKRIN